MGISVFQVLDILIVYLVYYVYVSLVLSLTKSLALPHKIRQLNTEILSLSFENHKFSKVKVS